jgi:hypothetical protein
MTKTNDRPYCDVQTTAQLFGSSWASSSWSCQNRAKWIVNGELACTTHKLMYERHWRRAVKIDENASPPVVTDLDGNPVEVAA